DLALRLETPSEMRITVNRDPIGAQRRDEIERRGKRLWRLQREPVNEIDIDRIEARRTRCVHECSRVLFTLHAIDRALYFWIEILHAEAHAIETHVPQSRNRRGCHGAWIDF